MTPEGLKLMVSLLTKENIKLHLYQNLPGEKTKEISGRGYKEASLKAVSITTGQKSVTAVFQPVEFVFEGNADRIYGSYAVHEPTGTILWSSPLEESFKAINKGDNLTIEPVFVFNSKE